MKRIILSSFLFFMAFYLFAQSDTVPVKKYSIELSASSLGMITNYYNNELQALGGSFMSANFGINKNKHKYSAGMLLQVPRFLGYSTTKIGGSFCYQYFPNPKRKIDFYFFSELKYIYSTFSGTGYIHVPYQQTVAALIWSQKFNTVNMAAGYGFYVNVYRSFFIGTDVEAGAGFFSFKEKKEIPDYPQWSSNDYIGMFENKHFSLGAKVSLMYNFN